MILDFDTNSGDTFYAPVPEADSPRERVATEPHSSWMYGGFVAMAGRVQSSPPPGEGSPAYGFV